MYYVLHVSVVTCDCIKYIVSKFCIQTSNYESYIISCSSCTWKLHAVISNSVNNIKWGKSVHFDTIDIYTNGACNNTPSLSGYDCLITVVIIEISVRESDRTNENDQKMSHDVQTVITSPA